MKRLVLTLACGLVLANATQSAIGQERWYPAEVERVVDGDTYDLAVTVWPGLVLHERFRLRDVDTPEVYGRVPDCEKALGAAASAFARDLLTAAEAVTVQVFAKDRYGRWVASIRADGQDLGDALLAAGHALPYEGARHKGWCTD